MNIIEDELRRKAEAVEWELEMLKKIGDQYGHHFDEAIRLLERKVAMMNNA